MRNRARILFTRCLLGVPVFAGLTLVWVLSGCGSKPEPTKPPAEPPAAAVEDYLQAYRAGIAQAEKGEDDAAEKSFTTALASGEEFQAKHPKELADSFYRRAELKMRGNRGGEAAGDYRRALVGMEKAGGGSDPRKYATIQNALGLCYFQQRDYGPAEGLFRGALAGWEKVGEGDSADVARAANNLASVYKFQGKYADAEPLFRRALMIKEKSLGAGDPAVARSCSNLAQLYEAARRTSDAEPLYRRALKIWNAAAPGDADAARARRSYAAALIKLGRGADAQSILKGADPDSLPGRQEVAVATATQSADQKTTSVAVAEPLNRP